MTEVWAYSLLLLVSSSVCSAHYAFSQLIVNNSVTGSWEYMRNVTIGFQNLFDPRYEVGSQFAPYHNVYDENIRCGRGATTSGNKTKTAVVIAGDEIGFQVGTGYYSANTTVYHRGPGQAYMSKAPGNLESYTGDGDWFKIGAILAKNEREWATTNKSSLIFTIPRTTPPGKYLVRVEHLYLWDGFNRTQFYVNCAQVEVIGPGGGNPGPLVKFPGAYDLWDPSIWVPREFSDHGANYGCSDLMRYTPPGPPVWLG